MLQPTLNQVKAKRIFEEEVPTTFVSDDNVNYWYDIALGVVKKGAFGAIITRSEAVQLAALQMHIVYGNYDKNKHKTGFLDEKGKSTFIYITYRKDLTIEADIYQYLQKFVGVTELEAKKSYILMTRILKRAVENVFEGYIFSADKIETRPAVLVVSHTVTIFDSATQENIHAVPILKIKAWHNQHTSATERDKLRASLGHVSHLHQIILDLGEELPVIRFLSANRDVIRSRLETLKSHVLNSIKEKESAEAKKQEELQATMESGELPPIQPLTILWLANFDEPATAKLVEVKLIPRRRMVILDSKTNEIILQKPLNEINSWRQEHTSFDQRNKLSITEMKEYAYDAHQLYIECKNDNKPIRLLALERWRLRDALKKVMDDLSLVQIEEFPCLLFVAADSSVKPVNLTFHEDFITLKSPQSDQILQQISLTDIKQIDNKRLDEDLKKLFNSEVALILRLNSTTDPVILGTEHHLNISMELKPLVDRSKKRQAGQSLPLNCELINDKNEQAKNVTVNFENCKLIIKEEGNEKPQELDTNTLNGWVFSLHLKNSPSVLLQSHSSKDIKNLIEILKNLQNKIKNEPLQTKTIIEEKRDEVSLPTQNDAKTEEKPEKNTTKDEEDSGSGIEIGGISNSNSEEDM